MSQYLKFSEWVSRRDENLMPAQQVGQPSTPASQPAVNQTVQADAAKKMRTAMQKYQVDYAKMGKDPRLTKQTQDKIVADPQLGPEVAAQIFKGL